MGDLWVMSQYISMGYGLLQVYGLSLVTESVDAKIHGLLQVMGYHNDGLGQSRLYPVGGVPCLRFRSSEVSDLRRPSSLEGLLRGWVASATPRFTLAGSDSICWASSMVGEARYL